MGLVNTVDVDFRKWPDTPHWHHQMYLLGDDDFGRWLWAPRGTVAQKGEADPQKAEDTWVKLIPTEGWWSAIFRTGSDLDLYVDVCTPAEWNENSVKMVDLDLDILRDRDSGIVTLDDEDEFLKHQVDLGYPQSMVAAARTTAAELMITVEQHREPFGEVGARWLEKAKELEAGGHFPPLSLASRWLTETKATHSPTVSVIIPVRNGGKYIGAALDAIASQDYDNIVEIVIADGNSTDDTVSVIAARSVQDQRIRVVENPGGTTPAGLNKAIEATTGDVIVRCDAQAELPPDYVSTAVATLHRTGAANVGGVQHAEGVTTVQRAIAYAMTSRVGIGDAAFRYGGPEGEVDTVYLGVFDRQKLDDVGRFDETLIRNQDYELNARLRKAGHTVWFDPSLSVLYRPRVSLRALAVQYWQYGAWKRHVVISGMAPLRLRQLAPPLLILAFLVTGALFLAGSRVPFFAVSAVYEIVLYGTTALWLFKTRDKAAIGFAAAAATMHFAWGAGFLVGRRQRPTDV